ncbi:MAG: DUF3285 domain-containing protein [Cyanothece sp. SIO1E1]|nr:DUF3285 domain-containing protein [Cyanothece sp. SIO1E1]
MKDAATPQEISEDLSSGANNVKDLDSVTDTSALPSTAPIEPQPSYVKLAMRNMVRKGGKSLFHFTLTTMGLLAVLVGLSYLTR